VVRGVPQRMGCTFARSSPEPFTANPEGVLNDG
jgi:hypothetical protein